MTGLWPPKPRLVRLGAEQQEEEEDGPSPVAASAVVDAAAGASLSSPRLLRPACSSDYAYQEGRGYSGLLLHAISPRLAERVYPYIATETAEKFIVLCFLVGGGMSSTAIVSTRVPVQLALASFAMYIPALHRTLLIDLRELVLMLRQFETWYMFVSMGKLHVSVYAIWCCTCTRASM